MSSLGIGDIQEEARSRLRRRRRAETRREKELRLRVAAARGIRVVRRGRSAHGSVAVSADRDALLTQARMYEKPRTERSKAKRLREKG